MSDSSTTPDSSAAADSSAAPRSEPPRTSSRTRSWVLLAVLAVLLIALAYDYQVARPQVHQAYERITDRHEEISSSAREILTDQQIHALLDKEPSRTFSDGSSTVEVYSWASGLPFRTHDLFVVYQKSGDHQMFLRHSKFAFDSSSDLKQQSEGDAPSDRQEPEPMVTPEGGRAPSEEPAAEEPAAEESPADQPTGG